VWDRVGHASAGDERSAVWAAAPSAAIGERPEQADRPAGRTPPPRGDSDAEEKQRDGADDPDQDDRKCSGERADSTPQDVLGYRVARERGPLNTWHLRQRPIRHGHRREVRPDVEVGSQRFSAT
jgi:hypothetical protein